MNRGKQAKKKKKCEEKRKMKTRDSKENIEEIASWFRTSSRNETDRVEYIKGQATVCCYGD